MKVGGWGEIKDILLQSWLPIETYHKNLANWNFFFFEIWQILGLFFFPNERSFEEVEITFFRSKFGQISPPKKHPFRPI